MPQTIKNLWNGNIAPCERCGAHDPTALNLAGLIERNREKLRAGLTEAQMEIFQKFIDCTDEYEIHMLELAFYDGFSLGSKLAVEALFAQNS